MRLELRTSMNAKLIFICSIRIENSSRLYRRYMTLFKNSAPRSVPLLNRFFYTRQQNIILTMQKRNSMTMTEYEIRNVPRQTRQKKGKKNFAHVCEWRVTICSNFVSLQIFFSHFRPCDNNTNNIHWFGR